VTDETCESTGSYGSFSSLVRMILYIELQLIVIDLIWLSLIGLGSIIIHLIIIFSQFADMR
jgi:hypothetical protein